MDILLQNYTTNFKRITFLYFIHYIKMEGKSLLNMPPFQYYLRKFRYLLDCGTSCLKVKVAALCLTPCGPVDCSPPGASVHGIFQARILEWVAIPSSRRSCQPRDRTQASCTGGGFLTIWATREALKALIKAIKKKKRHLEWQLMVFSKSWKPRMLLKTWDFHC